MQSKKEDVVLLALDNASKAYPCPLYSEGLNAYKNRSYENIMLLVDKYTELRHSNGSHLYNVKTQEARNAVIKSLTELNTMNNFIENASRFDVSTGFL